VTPLDSRTKAALENTLQGVIELCTQLESTLDRSLTDLYIDANRYINKYNQYRNDLFSLLPDEDIGEILTEMPTYIYTGDDQSDVGNVKMLLVEVYLKTSQLMAYLQNLLELG
jgi:hypothetical protein